MTDAKRAGAGDADPLQNLRPEGSRSTRQIADQANTRVGYLLAELRAAVLRARLWEADITAVALALKAGLVEPEHALELLHECDALHLVGPVREDAA